MEMSAELIRSLYVYDSDTGNLIWRMSPFRSKRKAGDIAGSYKKNGRWEVKVGGRGVLRSRIVWLYHHGSLPNAEIDHINRDASDDRIENLREATRSQQLVNRRLMGHNSCGFHSIYLNKKTGLWAVRISINGKRKRFGSYRTVIEAAQAADRIGLEAYGNFWNPKIPIAQKSPEGFDYAALTCDLAALKAA